MLVVNLFGPPCSGKSTTAAQTYAELKRQGYNTELVREVAQDYIYDNKSLDDQILIFAEQQHRLKRLEHKVDIVVTDSPILLSIVYDKSNNIVLRELILSEFRKYNNLNFLLERQWDYTKENRVTTEEESQVVQERLKELLCDFPYYTCENIVGTVCSQIKYRGDVR